MNPEKDIHPVFEPNVGMERPLSYAPIDLGEAEELCASLKRVAVRSEHALDNGDAADGFAQLERWVESYRRGLAAAQKISCSGIGLLQRVRDKLALSLEERLRLEDEGGNPPTKEQASENEDLARALKQVDRLLAQLTEQFPQKEPTPEAA